MKYRDTKNESNVINRTWNFQVRRLISLESCRSLKKASVNMRNNRECENLSHDAVVIKE